MAFYYPPSPLFPPPYSSIPPLRSPFPQPYPPFTFPAHYIQSNPQQTFQLIKLSIIHPVCAKSLQWYAVLSKTVRVPSQSREVINITFQGRKGFQNSQSSIIDKRGDQNNSLKLTKFKIVILNDAPRYYSNTLERLRIWSPLTGLIVFRGSKGTVFVGFLPTVLDFFCYKTCIFRRPSLRLFRFKISQCVPFCWIF